MPAKRKAPARKPYARKKPMTSYRRKARTTVTDGQSLLVSSYFEVEAKQASANATGGLMAYSIRVDPVKATVKIASGANVTGTIAEGAQSFTVKDGANGNIIEPNAAEGDLPFTRLAAFQNLYRQYKVNSFSIKVTADRECGIQNPMIMLTDRADDEPCVSVKKAMDQGHISKVLTESNRTMSYGWRPKTTMDREYHNINDLWNAKDCYYLKILQQTEPKNDGICTHRVEVVASVTLKDSKSGN